LPPLDPCDQAEFKPFPELEKLAGRDRRCIKGQKYTLLSRKENLTLDGKRALKTLLSTNKRLNTAYILNSRPAPLPVLLHATLRPMATSRFCKASRVSRIHRGISII
jgi:hypothetical protein